MANWLELEAEWNLVDLKAKMSGCRLEFHWVESTDTLKANKSVVVKDFQSVHC